MKYSIVLNLTAMTDTNVTIKPSGGQLKDFKRFQFSDPDEKPSHVWEDKNSWNELKW